MITLYAILPVRILLFLVEIASKRGHMAYFLTFKAYNGYDAVSCSERDLVNAAFNHSITLSSNLP